MDIEEFYDADERRRQSAEVEYGQDWRDSAGTRYEISWIESTGELYAMREPAEESVLDPFGDIYPTWLPKNGVTVRVLAHVPSRARLDAALEGWQEAMGVRDSTRWVAQRIRQAGFALEGASDAAGGPDDI
jgi:hypothetical protein